MTSESTSPQANGGSWGAFLKSIASFNGDLSSLTAPPFILSATSLTEYSSYWCEHPNLFAAPAREPDPEKRALLVLKWFLTTLKQQYASRSENYGNEKKPLNPFLGELFLGRWEEEESGVTELVSEQVSHHPPATAYSITNIPTGIRLEGYNAQKASFSKTIHIKQIGHAILTVPTTATSAGSGGSSSSSESSEPDRYLITLPSLHIEGLIFGSPFIELDGASYITSSTGYTAKIDYSGKGWLSGKKNSFVATLYPTGREKDALYNVSGQWTKGFEIHVGPAKSSSPANLLEAWDPAAMHPVRLAVAPPERQHPLESRRAWAKVAAAIARGDMDAVGREKSRIEVAQRELRARERADGRMWQRRYFSVHIGPDPTLAELGAVVGLDEFGDSDKTGGLWRFDNAKAEKVREAGELAPEEAEALAKEVLGQ